jgi:uncharacterized protein (TIGR02118 family)
MAQILVLYPHPQDAAKFDRYYFDVHVPLARKIPGLRRFEVSRGTISGPGGPDPFHLVAILEFDSLAAIHQALETPESRAATDDLKNFAPAGVQIHLYDSERLA